MQNSSGERSNRHLKDVYNGYNRRYFGGKLPKIPVCWGDPRHFARKEGKGTLAVTNFFGNCPVNIVFAPWLKKTRQWQLIKFTLLHEMAHVALPAKVQHGEKFQNEMKRLARANAFEFLW